MGTAGALRSIGNRELHGNPANEAFKGYRKETPRLRCCQDNLSQADCEDGQTPHIRTLIRNAPGESILSWQRKDFVTGKSKTPWLREVRSNSQPGRLWQPRGQH